MFFDLDQSEDKDEETVPQANSSWNFSWNSLLDVVKKTSEQVKDIVVTDLNELAEASQGIIKNISVSTNDTAVKDVKIQPDNDSNILNNALDTLDDYAEKVESAAYLGISKIGNGIAFGLNTFLLGGSSSPFPMANRTESLIYEAGTLDETYLKPYLEEDSEKKLRYQEFKTAFDRISFAGRIASLIDQQPEIKEIQHRLVSEEEFWIRYFFRVRELELAQKSRVELIATVNEQDDEINWSSDDEKVNDVTEKTGVVSEPIISSQIEDQSNDITQQVSNLEINPEIPLVVENNELPNERIVRKTTSPKLGSDDLALNDNLSASSYDIIDRSQSQTTGKDAEEGWEGWD